MPVCEYQPIRRRNQLLVAAGGFFLASCGLGFPQFCLSSRCGFGVFVLIILAGYFAAMGIRECGGLLPGPQQPWYCRAGAIPFLTALTIVIGITVRVLLLRDSDARTFGAACIDLFLAGIGFELLWIVILDWPTVRDSGRAAPLRESSLKSSEQDSSERGLMSSRCSEQERDRLKD